jgi:hypothetical protein
MVSFFNTHQYFLALNPLKEIELIYIFPGWGKTTSYDPRFLLLSFYA